MRKKKTRPAPVADIFSLVRLLALRKRPYYASALMAAVPVSIEGLGTFAIDKFCRVYYDPAIVSELTRPGKLPNGRQINTVEEGATLLIHEIEHWVRRHAKRARPFIESSEFPPLTARLINLCTDAEINDDLLEQKLSMWRDVPPILPGQYQWPAGETWEEYYQRVRADLGNVEHNLRSKLEEAAAQDPDQWPACIAEDLGKYGPCIVWLLGGSGSHGYVMPFELPMAPGQPDGIESVEAELIRKETARSVLEHAKKNPGSVPGRMLRWAESELAAPQIPWQMELAALVKNAVASRRGLLDYSYSIPNRRGNFSGVIMPSLVEPVVDAAIVLDTSGSMSPKDLAAAMSEVQGILAACGQNRVSVYCCDAVAYEMQHIVSAEDLKLFGGGGTNMGVGIEEVRQRRHQVVVVLTDGFTPWPEEEPAGLSVVIGLVLKKSEEKQETTAADLLPPWARHVVEIEAERDETY